MKDNKIENIISKIEYLENKIEIRFKSLLNRLEKKEGDEEFINTIKKIKRDILSQNEYIAKYKHLDILTYDVETFMPIYKGVKKWSENEDY